VRRFVLAPIFMIAAFLALAGSALAHDITPYCVKVTPTSVTLGYHGEGLDSGQTIPAGINNDSQKNYFKPAGNVTDTTNQPSTFYNGDHQFTVPYNGQSTVWVVKHQDMAHAAYVKFPDDQSENCKTPPKVVVCKNLVPSDDTGRFDLKVDNAVVKYGAGNGDCGEGLFEPGNHTVSETAANGTNLGDYDSSVECVSDQQQQDPPGTSTAVYLHSGETLTCTFTNKHKPTPPPVPPPVVTPPSPPPVVYPPPPPKKHHPHVVRVKLRLPFFNQDPPLKSLAQTAKASRYGCRIVGPRTKLHGLAHWRVQCRNAKVLPGWRWYINGRRVHSEHWTYTTNKGRTLNSWLFDTRAWRIPNIYGHYTLTVKGKVRPHRPANNAAHTYKLPA
jgi:hypothetical protein